MKVDWSPISCGVAELYGIYPKSYYKHGVLVKEDNTPEEIVGHISKKEKIVAFYVFSDVADGPGRLLASFIEKNRLGSVVETRAEPNPSSGNFIKVWVWGPDWKRLGRFVNKVES